MVYVRRDVGKAIVLALRNIGGNATAADIKKEIGDQQIDGLTAEDISYTKTNDQGEYSPFNADFDFCIDNMTSLGYLAKETANHEFVLTELGKTNDISNFPTPEQTDQLNKYWKEKYRGHKPSRGLKKATKVKK
ncbi:hypothetical protein [Companilactobacillus sp.]|jgi:restriction system protein|uniref:hypothetical protein n=1 Tax=Companilactobacillus sp. TaxID=2767905 RepID=UPI0025C72636|nr:hypothetical protein [Companilactobacillus sp.]MCH4009678.1 hypothetical protein [Companilactobacillus sp.]MCH4052646.1 hypothetical protein [Companilactobacillus sp.]MCH4077620.1 hypothetical protein [Companilactobacillus sp.]MCH4126196.1 hypothetical protein [Companilactobacillus sp.]MCI1311904.1 hypothetical protein [Companilactobacillus sp.]